MITATARQRVLPGQPPYPTLPYPTLPYPTLGEECYQGSHLVGMVVAGIVCLVFFLALPAWSHREIKGMVAKVRARASELLPLGTGTGLTTSQAGSGSGGSSGSGSGSANQGQGRVAFELLDSRGVVSELAKLPQTHGAKRIYEGLSRKVHTWYYAYFICRRMLVSFIVTFSSKTDHGSSKLIVLALFMGLSIGYHIFLQPFILQRDNNLQGLILICVTAMCVVRLQMLPNNSPTFSDTASQAMWFLCLIAPFIWYLLLLTGCDHRILHKCSRKQQAHGPETDEELPLKRIAMTLSTLDVHGTNEAPTKTEQGANC